MAQGFAVILELQETNWLWSIKVPECAAPVGLDGHWDES